MSSPAPQAPDPVDGKKDGQGSDQPSPVVVVMLAFMFAFMPMSTDIYIPALPSIRDALGATTSQAQLTLSAFIFGFALTTGIVGPLSDAWGRLPVIVCGLVGYIGLTGLCMTATDINTLILLRSLQGACASVAAVMSRAVVRDLWPGSEGGRVFAVVMGLGALIPTVGPIVGGLMTERFGWHGPFMILLVISVLVVLSYPRIIGETLPPARRHDRGVFRVFSAAPAMMRHRQFMLYSLIMTFSYGVIPAFISGVSFVLSGELDVPPGLIGLYFAAAPLGFAIGAIGTSRVKKDTDDGFLIRLGLLVQLGVLIISVVWISGFGSSIPAVLITAFGAFLACGIVMPVATAVALSTFPERTGSATGLMMVIQCLIGAGIGAAAGAVADMGALALFAVMTVSAATALVIFTVARSRRDTAAAD